MRALLLVTMGIAMLAAGCSGRSQQPPNPEHELVRSQLGLKYPYRLQNFAEYQDGGSICGVLIGANHRKVAFWWDGQLRVHGQKGPRNAYIGTTKPNDRRSRKLLVGSQEEAALITALRGFADQSLRRSDQDSLCSILYNYTVPVSQRVAALAWMNDQQRLALDAVHLAEFLERQRQ